jgi:exosortase
MNVAQVVAGGVRFRDSVSDSIRTNPRVWIQTVLLIVPLAVMYTDTFVRLAGDWWNDPNSSHGILIPPLALYFAWRKRQRYAAAPVQPALAAGLVVVIGSLLVFFVGRLGAEFFLTRVSLLGLVSGMILWFAGWKRLRVMAFPLGFLLLAIPIPALIFNTVSIPLQSLASDMSAGTLNFCDVPVLQEGNVLQLATTSLGVAEACSGLRSLVSLIALAVILGYLRWRGMGQRILLVILAVPVALALNVLRISVTGIIAERWSVKYAMGFFHELDGWVIFVLAFTILYGLSSLVQLLWPSAPPDDDAEEAAAAARLAAPAPELVTAEVMK